VISKKKKKGLTHKTGIALCALEMVAISISKETTIRHTSNIMG